MAKLAYLGPEYSFSHDLARKEFRSHTHIPCSTLEEVVKSVVVGTCENGIVPFYNTTKRSIEETQLELIKAKGKVFVHDVIPLKVDHFLCGFGSITKVREVRSKNVVFYQTSQWLKKRLPNVKTDTLWKSTAEAIASLVKNKPPQIAAIGSKNACNGYGVPILAKRIENKPNVTSFFVLGKNEPSTMATDRVLMCMTKATLSVKKEITQIVGKSGCLISSNWPLANGSREAYFFEIDGEYSKLDLQSTVCDIKNRFGRNVFVAGAYSGKCITSLTFDMRKEHA